MVGCVIHDCGCRVCDLAQAQNAQTVVDAGLPEAQMLMLVSVPFGERNSWFIPYVADLLHGFITELAN